MNDASSARAASAALRFVMLSVFLNMLGAGLVVPVLPGWLHRYAIPPEHLPLAYGGMLACYSFVQFFAAPWLGALSDRYGRRPLLLAGMAGSAADFAAMAFAPGFAWLLAWRLVGGMTSSGGAVAGACVADMVPPEQRTRAMGGLAAMTGLGLVIGPGIGGLLSAWHPRAPFLAAAALCAGNLVYGWLALPESLPPERRRGPAGGRSIHPFAALSALWGDRALRRPASVFALIQFAQMTVQAVWVLSNSDRFGWGDALNGGSLFFAGVLSVLVQGVLLGRAAARLGEARLLRLALAVAAICQLLYAVATRGWMMFAIIALSMPGFAGVPLLQSLISRRAGSAGQGAVMGGLGALASAAAVLAPLPATLLLGVPAQPGGGHAGAAPLPFLLAAVCLGIGWWVTRGRAWPGTVADAGAALPARQMPGPQDPSVPP